MNLKRTINDIKKDNNHFNLQTVNEGAVERTVDSGRYFVLRIVNPQGKHAYIGMAFNERNDAFDFNVALQEHKSELEREDQAAKGIGSSLLAPLRDLSLKAGEKIKINVPKKKKPIAEGSGSGSVSGSLLPPPGSGGGGFTSVSTPVAGVFTPSPPLPTIFHISRKMLFMIIHRRRLWVVFLQL